MRKILEGNHCRNNINWHKWRHCSQLTWIGYVVRTLAAAIFIINSFRGASFSITSSIDWLIDFPNISKYNTHSHTLIPHMAEKQTSSPNPEAKMIRIVQFMILCSCVSSSSPHAVHSRLSYIPFKFLFACYFASEY